MRDWEEIKTKWDGSSTEYLKLDYGLLEVRKGCGGAAGLFICRQRECVGTCMLTGIRPAGKINQLT
jgi:hypothetical protein